MYSIDISLLIADLEIILKTMEFMSWVLCIQ